MNEILQRIAEFINFISTGAIFARVGLTPALTRFATFLYDKANKASGGRVERITLPSQGDAIALLTAALGAGTSQSNTTSWSDPRLKVVVSSLLAGLSYLADRSSHYDKVEAYRKQQLELMGVLDKLLPLIKTVETRTKLSDPYTKINQDKLTADGFAHYWRDCCGLQITLKSGGSPINFYNIDNVANRYKVASNLAALSATAITVANIVYICTTTNMASPTPTPSSSPVYSSSSFSPTTSPTSTPASEGANIVSTAAYIPLRLVSDYLTQCCSFETSKMNDLFSKIIADLKAELARVKMPTVGGNTTPLEVPHEFITFLKVMQAPEQTIKDAEEISRLFEEHNKGLNDIERQENIDQRSKAEKERDAAVSAKDVAEKAKGEAIIAKDAAILERDAAKDQAAIHEAKSTSLAQELEKLGVELQAEKADKAELIVVLEEVVSLALQSFIDNAGTSYAQKIQLLQQLKNKIKAKAMTPEIQKLFDNVRLQLDTAHTASQAQVSDTLLSRAGSVVDVAAGMDDDRQLSPRATHGTPLTPPARVLRSLSNSGAKAPTSSLVAPPSTDDPTTKKGEGKKIS